MESLRGAVIDDDPFADADLPHHVRSAPIARPPTGAL
jgi:hypothetical protein